MPTGYTAPVADGSITHWQAYVKLCARALGVCVTMRDEPLGAELPEKFEPAPFYSNNVVSLKGRHMRLSALTDEQIVAEHSAERQKIDEGIAKYHAEASERKARYEKMIADVEAWEGAPLGIKEFALSQLQESIQFDCGGLGDLSCELSDDPKVWHEQTLCALAAQIERAERDLAQEIERVASRNAWLAQLRSSLGEA